MMKAELKKAKPNLIKTYLNWILVIPVTWMLAHFYVDFYNPDGWPHVGLIQFGFDVFEKYPKMTSGTGGFVGILTGAYHWYEIYRKRV